MGKFKRVDNVQHKKAKRERKWIKTFSVTDLIGEIKTVNFGHVRDDAII